MIYLSDVLESCQGKHPGQYPTPALVAVAVRHQIDTHQRGWKKQAAKIIRQAQRGES
jgi:hypothetical protein